MSESTTTRSAVGRFRAVASRILLEVGFLAVVVGWSLFWLNVVRIHYSQGALTDAAFTSLLFIAPAVLVLLWRTREALGVDVPATPATR